MTGEVPVSRPVRVLVIDDSALVRKLLSDLLRSDPRIDVVGSAPDAYVARTKIKTLNPETEIWPYVAVIKAMMGGTFWLKNKAQKGE